MDRDHQIEYMQRKEKQIAFSCLLFGPVNFYKMSFGIFVKIINKVEIGMILIPR